MEAYASVCGFFFFSEHYYNLGEISEPGTCQDWRVYMKI